MADRRIELRKELKALDNSALIKRYAKVVGRTVADAKQHVRYAKDDPRWREIAIDVVVHGEAPQ